jgi:hypothetical protein
MLNTNQGFLTAEAIVLTVVAVWAGIILEVSRRASTRKQAEKDTAERKRRVDEEADLLLSNALQETFHNLIHISQVTDAKGRIVREAQISDLSVQKANALTSTAELRQTALWRKIDAVFRTFDRLQNEIAQHPMSPGNENLRLASLYQSYIACSFIFLFAAFEQSEAFRTRIKGGSIAENFARIQELAEVVREARHIAKLEDCMRYDHLSSGAAPVAAELRQYDVPIACWIKDQDLPPLRIFEFAPMFRALSHQSALGGTQAPRRFGGRQPGQHVDTPKEVPTNDPST